MIGIRCMSNTLEITKVSYKTTLTAFSAHSLVTGGAGLMAHFNNSLQRALLDTYLNHPWKINQFLSVARGWYEESPDHRRQFFLDFAKANNHKSMEDWYSVQMNQLKSSKGTRPSPIASVRLHLT